MKRESTTAYLLRNGWIDTGHRYANGKWCSLWNHSDSDLREVNGFPMFKSEAVEKQRARDRRGL